jgi:hypothetical protein
MKRPKEEKLNRMKAQLSYYRLLLAKSKNIDMENISVAFYFASTGETKTFKQGELLSEEEIFEKIEEFGQSSEAKAS